MTEEQLQKGNEYSKSLRELRTLLSEAKSGKIMLTTLYGIEIYIPETYSHNHSSFMKQFQEEYVQLVEKDIALLEQAFEKL